MSIFANAFRLPSLYVCVFESILTPCQFSWQVCPYLLPRAETEQLAQEHLAGLVSKAELEFTVY